jgi:hypothetical protein
MMLKCRILTWAFALIGVAGAQPAERASDYCAFEIHVRSSSGAAVSGRMVNAVDERGMTRGALTDAAGLAKICDTPAGLIDITVGEQRCGAVTIRHLRPNWLQPRRVVVIYDDCSGDDHVPPAGCYFTIRVRDEQDRPIGGVAFDIPAGLRQVGQQTSVSDQYGRVFRFVPFRADLVGRFRKPGYVLQEITDPCIPGSPSRRERVITMKRE